MRQLLPNVYHLDLLRISNVFLFDGGTGHRWLVDCGHVLERPTLLLELRRLGLRAGDLTGLLVTHRHSDHAGNARFLQQRGVAVHAHGADAAVLDGTAPRARLSRGEGALLAGLFCAVENAVPARVTVDNVLEDGAEVGGFRVHQTPGHTEGSVFLRHAATGCLASGDGILTAHPPLTLRAGMCLAYPSYSVDMQRSHRAVLEFHANATDYQHLLPGHGKALVGKARERVMAFLEKRTVPSE